MTTMGIFVALIAAASINIGKVLQKRGTDDLPKFSLTASSLRSYLVNVHWISGFAADILGGVGTLVALSMAPVSIVQPVMGSGLGVAAVFSHFYLHEVLTYPEMMGCGMVVVGTIGVGLTAAAQEDSTVAPYFALCLLFFFVCLVGVAELQLRKKAWSSEIVAGIQMGCCFGLSASASRVGMLLASQYEHPLYGVGGVVCSVGLTTLGFGLQTKGLKDGRAVVIITYANIVAIVVAVLFGLLALGEPLPDETMPLVGRVLSLAVLLSGTLLLMEPVKVGEALNSDLPITASAATRITADSPGVSGQMHKRV